MSLFANFVLQDCLMQQAYHPKVVNLNTFGRREIAYVLAR